MIFACLGWSRLVYVEDDIKDLRAEVFRFDRGRRQSKGVTKHCLRVGRSLDRGSHHVDPLCFQCDADRLFELAFAETLVEFAIDDSLHTRVNLDTLLALLMYGNAPLRVSVDCLVNKRLHVLRLDHDIKLVTCLQSQAQSIVILLKMVEDFGANASCQASLGEGLLVHERLDLGERVRDLVPLVVYDQVKFLERVDLLVHLVAIEHGQEVVRGTDGRSSQ